MHLFQLDLLSVAGSCIFVLEYWHLTLCTQHGLVPFKATTATAVARATTLLSCSFLMLCLNCSLAGQVVAVRLAFCGDAQEAAQLRLQCIRG